MRRIVPFVCTAAVLISCTPSGNGAPTVGSAKFRVANMVDDVNGITAAYSSGPFIVNTQFGTASLYAPLPADSEIITLTQSSDGAALGTFTFGLQPDLKYTMYGLGKLATFAPLLLSTDTVPALAGQFKVRFIHGVGTYSPFALDFFADTTSSLTGLTPDYHALGYETASPYVIVDTAMHRLRITKSGLLTTIVDTTFATPIASGSVVTIIATNVQGGGLGVLIHVVADTIP